MHDERALAGWWKKHYPDEYDQFVNRFTVGRTRKTFKSFVDVPEIPQDLKDQEPVTEKTEIAIPEKKQRKSLCQN